MVVSSRTEAPRGAAGPAGRVACGPVGVGAASGSVHLVVSPGRRAPVTLMVGVVLRDLRLIGPPASCAR